MSISRMQSSCCPRSPHPPQRAVRREVKASLWSTDISEKGQPMSWLPSQDPKPGDPRSCDAIEHVIVPRARDLGGFEVRRALPAAQKQMVRPFIFFDQMGPAEFLIGKGIDVRPHPHIGLATVTYLFEGEVFHRDSLGTSLAIRPGEVNLMRAGRGIVHSERETSEPNLIPSGFSVSRRGRHSPRATRKRPRLSPTTAQPSCPGSPQKARRYAWSWARPTGSIHRLNFPTNRCLQKRYWRQAPPFRSILTTMSGPSMLPPARLTSPAAPSPKGGC